MADIELNWSEVEEKMVALITAGVGTAAKKVFNAKTRDLAQMIGGKGPFPAIGVVHADFSTEGAPTENRIPVKGTSRFVVFIWDRSGAGPIEATKAGTLQALVRKAIVNEVGTPAGMMVGRFYLESEATDSVDGSMILLVTTFAMFVAMSA